MCILGAHTAFTVCCRSPRPGYHTTGEIPWRPMVLWMVVCRVSAVPNSPPGTTTEPPCCHCQNFLQILLLKEFSSFPLSRPSRVATSRQAGRYCFKTVSSVHPFCTFTRPQFRSPTSRHRTLWSRESSRLPFVSHRTTICALFSVRVPHSLTPS